MPPSFLIRFIISLLRGGGIIALAAPIGGWWFIYGSYNRYVWVISGPFPLSVLGSWSWQALFAGASIVAGGGMLVAAWLLQRRQDRRAEKMLARLFREAEQAHHRFEQQHGHDTDWPTWYAHYIWRRWRIPSSAKRTK